MEDAHQPAQSWPTPALASPLEPVLSPHNIKKSKHAKPQPLVSFFLAPFHFHVDESFLLEQASCSNACDVPGARESNDRGCAGARRQKMMRMATHPEDLQGM
eukprot:497092-Amphidinium_carterae.1